MINGDGGLVAEVRPHDLDDPVGVQQDGRHFAGGELFKFEPGGRCAGGRGPGAGPEPGGAEGGHGILWD